MSFLDHDKVIERYLKTHRVSPRTVQAMSAHAQRTLAMLSGADREKYLHWLKMTMPYDLRKLVKKHLECEPKSPLIAAVITDTTDGLAELYPNLRRNAAVFIISRGWDCDAQTVAVVAPGYRIRNIAAWLRPGKRFVRIIYAVKGSPTLFHRPADVTPEDADLTEYLLSPLTVEGQLWLDHGVLKVAPSWDR